MYRKQWLLLTRVGEHPATSSKKPRLKSNQYLYAQTISTCTPPPKPPHLALLLRNHLGVLFLRHCVIEGRQRGRQLDDV